MIAATDIGGTFTDFIINDSGELRAFKKLTTKNPSDGILDQLSDETISIEEFSHGTTVAVNAILERTGAPVTFFTTRGFKDLVRIGRQARSNVYSLLPIKPELPLTRIVRVTERTAVDGKILTHIFPQELAQAGVMYEEPGHAAVIGFINSFSNPENEQIAARILKKHFDHVFISSNIRREIREYERFCTAIIEGYCAPVVSDYLQELESLSNKFYIMQSNGGKNHARYVRAVNMVMSGPAGGVAAAQSLCKQLNIENAIAYDMGGTSADVSAIVSSKPVYTDTVNITGIPIRSLAIDIESIGAGGGSIAWIDDGGALKVGPMSAGSIPGPACYNNGGTNFTVSDANLILGILGKSISKIELDPECSENAAKPLCDSLQMDPTKLSSGVRRIVNNNMVAAVKRISVSKGYDPRKFTLIAFGGAGPMHACGIANALGMKNIVIPPYAGAFSAFGIMTAPIRFDFIRTILQPLDKGLELVPVVLDEFYDELKTKLKDEFDSCAHHESLDIRYKGQGHEINVPFDDNVASAFHARHGELYGFKMEDDPIEVVNVKLVSELPTMDVSLKQHQPRPVKVREKRNVNSTDNVNVYKKDFFNESVTGPCIIEGDTNTVYMEPGWSAKLELNGILKLEREQS